MCICAVARFGWTLRVRERKQKTPRLWDSGTGWVMQLLAGSGKAGETYLDVWGVEFCFGGVRLDTRIHHICGHAELDTRLGLKAIQAGDGCGSPCVSWTTRGHVGGVWGGDRTLHNSVVTPRRGTKRALGVMREQEAGWGQSKAGTLHPSPPTPLGHMCDIPHAPLAALEGKQIVNLPRSQSCKTGGSLGLTTRKLSSPQPNFQRQTTQFLKP